MLDDLLERLWEARLHLRLDEQGQPHVQGPRDQLTPGLLQVLRTHREEIVQRLRRPPRRIVLLEDGPRSPVEQVLWEGDSREHHPLCRRLGLLHRGRHVAAEWLSTLPGGRQQWLRFLTLCYPVP